MVDNCIFCKIVRGEIGAQKVYEDEHTLAFLDITPKTERHALVIPKKHYVNMFDIPVDELGNVMFAVKQVVEMYDKEYGMKNVNIVNNSGALAGQEVFHLHMHIIPRSAGDGIKMSWKTHPEWQEKFNEMLQKLEA